MQDRNTPDCLSTSTRGCEPALLTCSTLHFQHLVRTLSGACERMRRVRVSQHWAAVRGSFCTSDNTGSKFRGREASASLQEGVKKLKCLSCTGVVESRAVFGKIPMILRDHDRLE